MCAQVFVDNCVNVFAVTVPIAYGRVDMIQSTSQATIVDLPMPWPEAIATRTAATV